MPLTKIEGGTGRPFADPTRAAEIALMEEFGLAEFTELTGVGLGTYGGYRVGTVAVAPRAIEGLREFNADEQNALHTAARHLTLTFPCTPAQFVAWYDATRGATHRDAPNSPGVSDFPLAPGFLEELRRHEDPSSSTVGPSVPSQQIVAAFKVKLDSGDNASWWGLRLRNPGKYRLKDARAMMGKGHRPSRWYPLMVAGWLIDREHLSREDVVRAMRHSFPEYDVEMLL